MDKITHVPEEVCTPDGFRNKLFNESDWKDKLNLGCGSEYLHGWINLDYSKETKADVYHDLEETPLPFKDGQFDFVYASHILEHIKNLPQLKLELNRIVRTPGIMVVVVPYYSSSDAWGDDTHCRAFSEMSFANMYWPGFGYQEVKHIPVTFSNGIEGTWLTASLGKLKQQD